MSNVFLMIYRRRQGKINQAIGFAFAGVSFSATRRRSRKAVACKGCFKLGQPFQSRRIFLVTELEKLIRLFRLAV